MKYFMIAGEASGDLHGANLIRAIKEIDPHVEFQFWGGNLMNKATKGLLKHYRDVTIMGFIEVILNIRKIAANLALCKSQVDSFKPDVVILIDYPGFNLRIAEYCKKKGIRTVYYIAPKVWAWKENRVKKLEQFVDDLLIIFPFEVPYFKKWKVNATYVGNPLMDAIKQFVPDPAFRSANHMDARPSIALLPGSRKQEISKNLPKMIEATKSMSDYQLIIAGAPGIDPDYYTPYLTDRVKIVYDRSYDVLSISEAAVVCSGTATLETALLNIPQVCCYYANPLSYFIARMLVKIKYISLVNLCMERPVIRELIQHDMSMENIRKELNLLLQDKVYRGEMLGNYQQLRNLLYTTGASLHAAKIICGKA